MRVDCDKEEIVFSTGRREYANWYIIGISPSLDVSQGYDGHIDTDKFSPEERAELADYMIGLWSKFKALAKQEIDATTKETGT
jgi:hypothetical protein